MLQVSDKICYVGVDRNLVFPFEISPHLAEFGICTTSRHDVIHNVYVDIIKHYDVSVRSGTGDVVHNIPEDVAALSGCHLDDNISTEQSCREKRELPSR